MRSRRCKRRGSWSKRVPGRATIGRNLDGEHFLLGIDLNSSGLWLGVGNLVSWTSVNCVVLSSFLTLLGSTVGKLSVNRSYKRRKSKRSGNVAPCSRNRNWPKRRNQRWWILTEQQDQQIGHWHHLCVSSICR